MTAGQATAATTAPLQYRCEANVFGQVVQQGTWTAEVTVDLPSQVTVGATIPAPAISAKVTTSTDAANTLRFLGETEVDGTSVAKYTLAGQDRSANLTIGRTAVPTSGALTTTATGTGAAETAPTAPGSLEVAVGDFTARIQTYKNGTPDLLLPITCTLTAGQDAKVGTIDVVAAETTTTEPTTSEPTTTEPTTSEPATTDPTTSEPTTTEPTTSEPTGTTEPTTSEPTTTEPTGITEPTATTEPTTTTEPTGPVTPSTVQTDGGAPDGGANLWTVAGVGAGALGLLAVAGASLSGRRED